jgi:hypothetical protein
MCCKEKFGKGKLESLVFGLRMLFTHSHPPPIWGHYSIQSGGKINHQTKITSLVHNLARHGRRTNTRTSLGGVLIRFPQVSALRKSRGMIFREVFSAESSEREITMFRNTQLCCGSGMSIDRPANVRPWTKAPWLYSQKSASRSVATCTVRSRDATLESPGQSHFPSGIGRRPQSALA